MIARVARHTAIACVVTAVIFASWMRSIAALFAVLGGGVLIGISFWAIRSTVDELMPGAAQSRGGLEGAKADETRRKTAGFALVKFFTRHGIVALGAYGMMVRLHLDPVGLLLGVSSLGVAVAVEVLKDLRWRRFP
jgi:hypothetical protein